MRKWYSLKNESDTAEILIYDIIGKDFWGEGVGAKELVNELSKLENIKTINVRINSLGGDVMEGTAIYNSLSNHPASVNIIIDGWAISAASFIAMAGAGEGNSITMAENGMMMIHDPWGFAVGSAKDLRKSAEMMDKAKDNIIKTYQNKVDKNDQELSDMMEEETWMTGQEALDHGFVDSLTGSVKIENRLDNRIFNQYKHIPDGLMNIAPSKPKEKTVINNGRSVSHLSKEIELLELD